MSKPPPRRVHIRVPASTSNLGPGFDSLGMALSLFLDVEFADADEGEHSFTQLDGTASEWPRGGENLLLQAFDRGLGICGHRDPCPGHWRVTSAIPTGRGLGSSGAAITAGLGLAGALSGSALTRDLHRSLLNEAARMEGHPDNSTAAFLGGCTLGLPHDDALEVIQHPVHPSIGITVCWPSSPVSTRAAREALPDQVRHSDAVENARRMPFLLAGLSSGDGDLLRLGCEDRLHVQYRLPLIPGGREAIQAALDAGAFLATVSGSGSTMIALGAHRSMGAVRDAMLAELDARDGPAEGHIVQVVEGPPEVREGPLPTSS